MSMNLWSKIGSGITPLQFMEGMKNNKESFLNLYNSYKWNNPDDERFFSALAERSDIRCLILCTDWCPDVIWNVPVLLRVLEKADIPTEILLMEQHLETMDLFLTDGGRAQPIAVFVNRNGDVTGKWGPRPAYIQRVMDDFRKLNPDRGASDYQEKVTAARSEIAKLYEAGTEYQSVIVKELRTFDF